MPGIRNSPESFEFAGLFRIIPGRRLRFLKPLLLAGTQLLTEKL